MVLRHKSVAGLVVASALTSFGAAAIGQSVVTPYSPWESGPALTQEEEAAAFGGSAAVCETPYSPQECGPADMPARGGTVAPEMGGAIRIEGGSSTRLPVTPDSDLIPTD